RRLLPLRGLSRAPGSVLQQRVSGDRLHPRPDGRAVPRPDDRGGRPCLGGPGDPQHAKRHGHLYDPRSALPPHHHRDPPRPPAPPPAPRPPPPPPTPGAPPPVSPRAASIRAARRSTPTAAAPRSRRTSR